MMIKLICLKSIGNFILLPPPMSVCMCVWSFEVLLAENLDEDGACCCWYKVHTSWKYPGE